MRRKDNVESKAEQNSTETEKREENRTEQVRKEQRVIDERTQRGERREVSGGGEYTTAIDNDS